MKSTGPQIILDALAAHNALGNEIAALNTSVPAQAAIVKDLELNGDISTVEGLLKIAQEQTLMGLFPKRLADRTERQHRALADILNACNQFISEDLGPRCRKLAEAVRKATRDALSAHFDAELLDRTVEGTGRVREISHLCPSIQPAPPGGPIAFANVLLAANKRAEEIAKSLA